MIRALPLIVAFLGSLTCLAAFAASPPAAAASLTVGAETGMEVFAADAYATLALTTAASLDRVKLGLWAPLRLRVLDAEDRGHPVPGLRSEDWDERSDRLRVLRYLDATWSTGKIHIGEIVGLSIGHGTIVDRFYNDLDFDHHHTGVTASLDHGWIGAEAMLSDVLQGDLGALRLFGRPLLGHWSPLWRTLTLGGTLAADAANGYTTRTQPDGVHVLTSEVLLVAGVDVAATLLQRGTTTLQAYADLATQPKAQHDVTILPGQSQPRPAWSRTLSAGLLANLTSGTTTIRLRAEGNLSTAGDQARPIDTLYGVVREVILNDPRSIPLLTQTPGGVGGLLRMDLQQGTTRLVVSSDWRPGDGAGLFAWLVLQPSEALSLRAFAGQRHLASSSANGTGDGPLVQASARYRVQGPWFAALSVGRFYRWAQSQMHLDLDVAATVGADIGL